MDIKNPRRILAVSSADSTQHLVRVIRDLTGSHPDPAGPSLAGTTHSLALRTPYYAAEVPVWLDLVASPAEWAASFLSPEAREVLDVLGGIVVVFPLPSPSSPPAEPHSGDGGSGKVAPSVTAARDLIQGVGRVVREGLGGWEWDGVGLCLGVGEVDDVDEWEDCCAEWGLEFVQVRSQSVPGRNEFGEKTGIPRVLEALESNDWSQALGADFGLDLDPGSEFGEFEGEPLATGDKDPSSLLSTGASPGSDREGGGGDADLDPESLDFGFDREDFAGLKRAIWTAGRADDEDEDGDGDGDGDDDDTADHPPTADGGEPSSRGGTGGEGGSGPDKDQDRNRDGDEDQDDEKLDDAEVQKLERMMIKLQAVRDMSAGLSEDQRRRMAARAVGEVMKEL